MDLKSYTLTTRNRALVERVCCKLMGF